MSGMNLQVNLDTSKARESFNKLKDAIKSELKGTPIELNTQNLVKSIQGALTSTAFQIKLDVANFRAQVQQQLQGAANGVTIQANAGNTAEMEGAFKHSVALAVRQGVAEGLANIDLTRFMQKVGAATSSGVSSGRTAASQSYSYRSGDGSRVTARFPVTDVEGVRSSAITSFADQQSLRQKLLEQAREYELHIEKVAEEKRLRLIQESRDLEVYTLRSQEEKRLRLIQESRDLEVYNLQANEAKRLQRIQEARDMEVYTVAQSEAKKLKAMQESRDLELYRMQSDEAKRLQRIKESRDMELLAMREAERKAKVDDILKSTRFSFDGVYTSQGMKIAQAKSLVEQGFNAEAVSMFGSSVVAAIGNINQYKTKVSDATSVVRQHNEALKDAHSMARGLAGAVNAIWLTWGNIVPLVAGAAIGASVKNAVTEFANLQYQLTFVKALSGDVTVSMNELYAGVHRVSMSMGVAPEEAAKGLRALAQAGLDTKQALATLPDVFKLAYAGELSVADAAVSSVGIMNAYSMNTTTEVGRVADVLAKAGAASATSVSAITESMRYGAVAADQYGVSLEKAATILTVLGKRNIIGSSAGTAMKNMLSEIYSPSSTEARYIQKDVLGVKAFNADGTRKEIFAVIEEMRKALSSYNKESQGLILRAMFGERGDKAFGALLATTTDKIREIEGQIEGSAGFTTQVFVQQQQTLKGQWDLTITTIKDSFATIGETSANLAIEMLKQVREAFKSEVVRDSLTGLTQTVTRLSQALLTFGPIVAGAWAAVKVGSMILPMVTAGAAGLVTVMGAAGLAGTLPVVVRLLAAVNAGKGALLLSTTSLTGAGRLLVGAFAALASPMGIALSLVTGLATGYLILRNRKEGLLDLADKEIKSMSDVSDALERENTLLQKKILLLQQGTSLDGLDAAMEVEKRRSALDQMKERKTYLEGLPKSTGTILSYNQREELAGLPDAIKKYEDEYERLKRRMEQNTAWQRGFREQQRLTMAAENAKDQAALGAALGTGTRTYNPNHRKDASEAHADLLAENQGVLNALKAQEDRLRMESEFKKKRDELLYSADKYGPYLQAVLAEQREVENLNSQLEINARLRAEINSMMANPGLKDADRTRLKNEQAKFEESAAKLERQMAQQVEYARLKASVGAENVQYKHTKDMGSASVSVDKLMSEINRQYMPKQMGPLDTAEQEARSKAADIYRTEIERLTLEIARQKDAETALNATIDKKNTSLEQMKEMSKQAKTAWDAAAQAGDYTLSSSLAKDASAIESLNSYIALAKDTTKGGVETTREFYAAQGDLARQMIDAWKELNSLTAKVQANTLGKQQNQGLLSDAEKQSREAQDKVGAYARSQKSASMQASEGWDQFWKELKYNAEDSATTVKGALTGAFNKASDALATFVTTGKINFKSLVASMLAEAAKAMANKAMAQLFGMVANYAIGYFSVGSSTPATTSNGTPLQGNFDSNYSAWGNVMTSSGPMALQRYASGGIARRPQLSMFGEGSTPEAYVPLPDGRSIPVTVDGKGSSGDATAVNITVNVSSDGNSKVESDNSGNKAAQLGKMIEGVVTQVIVKEKRPGGLLYAS